jgi:apolipoprotein N-acyltransferase
MRWSHFRPQKAQIILAVSSGLLMILVFPKIDQGWLAWVALVPLILALRQADWRRGLVIGFIAGLIQNLGLMYWTIHTMHVYGQIPLYLCVGLLILLAAYMALYVAGFGLLLTRLRPNPWQVLLVAPALWIVMELLRAMLFSGFPWELLGYSQYDHLWILQEADLFGVYGLSGLIVMVNSVIALVVLHWIDKPWQNRAVSPRLLKWAGSLTITIVLATMLYGALRLRSVDDEVNKAPQKGVAVIQGNIDQAQKWDPSFQLLTTVKYKNLSRMAAAKGTDLIVWPETATPFYFLQDPVLTRMVIEGIKDIQADFIIGSPSAALALQGKHIVYHNSAYLLNAQGEVKGQYDKVHLVPFGEYVPLKRWLPFIHKLVAQVGDFEPGQRGTTLPWDDHPVGMQICYEVIFPGLVRAMVNNGAQLLVNITNDAWFDRTSAAYQHFSMAVFRAVENRRALVRAANTGISGFIDPGGRIKAATGLYEDAFVVSPVALLTQRTVYTRWGDWPLALAVLAVLAPWWIKELAGWWIICRRRFQG